MLQVHSYFSLRYGVLSPETIVSWMKEHGYTCFALTDINTSSAGLQFVRIAQEQHIRPVVGIDFRRGISCQFVGIARNNRGFHELNNFLSKHLHANTVIPNEPPHLNNCFIIYPLSNLPKRSLRDNEYIGIQTRDIHKLTLWKQHELLHRMVILQPMTFLSKKDFNTHRILRAIDCNTLLSKLTKDEQTDESEYLTPYDKLQHAFAQFPYLLAQTEALLSRCSIHFEFGANAKPQNVLSYTGDEQEDFDLLNQLTHEGISFRYPTVTEELQQRIHTELDLIRKKGFLSYFLITWDIINFARARNFFYVGRGSGANSIVAYLLRITNVDPLELDLYFERFINLYRSNPPDFDLDFSWKDRDEVIQYIFYRFPQAALLATYNTFQYKATIREVGKVFGLPKAEIDELSTLTRNPDNQLAQLVLKYSKYIEGVPSHLSIHAGGIIIPEKPITWFSATFIPPKGFPTTQFSMLEAEDVGLYKFDILSQRGLSKISECLEIIAKNQPDNPPHDIHDIHHFKQDEKIKHLIRHAEAIGCFYVESPAMRMLLKKLETDTYLGLVAASSIIRPGVARSGMMRTYILRHRFPEKRNEAHPIMQEIMPETYGVMVYQEDVIKVAHHFGGLSLAEADVLRRGMSGKFRSRTEFQRIQEQFKENCLKKGYTSELIDEIWFQIESFAGYAFSKGHSASYAVESYQSLYLKAYYPLEYLTATINNFGGFYRTEIYVHEARKAGAVIEAPSLNFGDYHSLLHVNKLYLGFNLVLGIETAVIQRAISERKNRGIFTDFTNLVKRVPIPLEQLILIIRIGGLRDFPESKKALLWRAHLYHNQTPVKAPQEELFPVAQKEFILPELETRHLEEAFEQLELLGFPLCSPFQLAKEPIPDFIQPFDADQRKVGMRVTRYGYLITVKRTRTSKGDLMYFGTFMNPEGDYFDTIHFPETAKKFPFRGIGLYKLEGIISEEFGVYTLEVGYMEKLPFRDDPRYTDESTAPNSNTENHTKSHPQVSTIPPVMNLFATKSPDIPDP
jgi:error-prone DNA polymerase